VPVRFSRCFPPFFFFQNQPPFLLVGFPPSAGYPFRLLIPLGSTLASFLLPRGPSFFRVRFAVPFSSRRGVNPPFPCDTSQVSPFPRVDRSSVPPLPLRHVSDVFPFFFFPPPSFTMTLELRLLRSCLLVGSSDLLFLPATCPLFPSPDLLERNFF